MPLRQGFVEGLMAPGLRTRRLTMGVLLVIGGMFGALPVLGFWMLPLGLLILAVDMAVLREPVSAMTIRMRRMIRRLRRRRGGNGNGRSG